MMDKMKKRPVSTFCVGSAFLAAITIGVVVPLVGHVSSYFFQEDTVDDLKAYEGIDCAASCGISSPRYKTASAQYADSLTLTIPYRGENLELDLQVDRDLFADDWKWTDGVTGEVIHDKELFMCHYSGEVVGKPDSTVAISVCEETGISGLITTQDWTAEMRPADLHSNAVRSTTGRHVIYDVNDLILPEGLQYFDDPFELI